MRKFYSMALRYDEFYIMMDKKRLNIIFQKNIKNYLDFPNTCIHTHTHNICSVTLIIFELCSDFWRELGGRFFV